jgi:glutathione S-transferase
LASDIGRNARLSGEFGSGLFRNVPPHRWVVPELQRDGLFHTGGTAATLPDNPGSGRSRSGARFWPTNQRRKEMGMKLYYAPGACSIGIHILLEEVGKPYDVVAVNLREGEQHKPAFTTVNPKSKVPTLARDDGSVLTEFPAIAYWLARSNPFANLLPDDIDQQAQALELLDYAVATIHMQGFGRQFRAANFTPNAADEEAVKTKGRDIAEKGFALVDKALAGKDYAVGQFSIADVAIFYVEFWSKRVGMTLPANCAAHFERMLARPSVQRVMQQEGLA